MKIKIHISNSLIGKTSLIGEIIGSQQQQKLEKLLILLECYLLISNSHMQSSKA